MTTQNAVETRPSISFVARHNSAGKACGTRFTFTGMETASDLRKRLKESGLKGKDLTTQVNRVLSGNVSAKRVLAQAAVTQLCEDGFVPDVLDMNQKKTTATMKWVKVEAPKLTADDVKIMSPEDKAMLLALLNAPEAKPALELAPATDAK